MSPSEEQIEHVSDTALMVAACRAAETERPDGLIRDPFAARLAGRRGMAISKGLPHVEFLAFGICMRIRFLDDLVTRIVRDEGVRTVLSVGSGLDSRPWRMDLPADLRWIEVDFPHMLDYKTAAMEGETPRCRHEQIAADLTDPSQRAAVFQAVGDAPTLMITEGLLMYLPADAVEALARDSHAPGAVRYWLLDVHSRAMAERMGPGFLAFDKVRSAEAIHGDDILQILGREGWAEQAHKSYTRDCMEVAAQRIMNFMANRPADAPPPPPPLVNDTSGVYLFARE